MLNTPAAGSTLGTPMPVTNARSMLPELHALQQFDIAAQRGVRKLLDGDRPAGALAHLFREHRGAGAELRLHRQDIANAQGSRAGTCRAGAAREHTGHQSGPGKKQMSAVKHGVLPMVCLPTR